MPDDRASEPSQSDESQETRRDSSTGSPDSAPPVLDEKDARQAEIVLDTRKKRRVFVTLLGGAIILLVAITAFTYIG